ncbi:major facilitator superfamily domain-containing protein [Daldinia decipiens]|uniref:major facilitator superfamily domain-containing protein n=1 Tax=Daldinia decipiens TaxID=326647 RepID=UPI0020C5536F|nr:major facilitator superfamily domain-containing protein [Daldinia decipiens]KAI1662431.1 major facilitator superfamily domain-containing protein [Daldinia decipiens]
MWVTVGAPRALQSATCLIRKSLLGLKTAVLVTFVTSLRAYFSCCRENINKYCHGEVKFLRNISRRLRRLSPAGVDNIISNLLQTPENLLLPLTLSTNFHMQISVYQVIQDMGNESLRGEPLQDQPDSSPEGQLSVYHDNGTPSTTLPKGWRFWAVFSAICFTTILAAVEFTVVSTALPFITRELAARDLYVWFINAYFLTSTVFLPLIGQMCDLFGRRWMMIAVVSLFVLGSGIAGGANNAAMMIAGRAVQGIGGGGVNLLIELVSGRNESSIVAHPLRL